MLDFGLDNEPIECGSGYFDPMLMPEKTETAPAETDATPTFGESQAAPSPGETPSAPTESAARPTSLPSLLAAQDLPAGDTPVVNVFTTEANDSLYILGEIENHTPGFIRNIHPAVAVFSAKPRPATEVEERIQGKRAF